MLALILATRLDVPVDFSKSTLIGTFLFLYRLLLISIPPTVVPLSVMSNWEKQIDDHCVSGVLSSCVYYGATRSMTPQELMKHDVVITTYQVRLLISLSSLIDLLTW